MASDNTNTSAVTAREQKQRKPRAKRYVGEEAQQLSRADVAKFDSFMNRLNKGEIDFASLVTKAPSRGAP